MAIVHLTETEQKHVSKLYDKLTSEEREVAELVVAGTLNKDIARQLGVSVRCIEARRSRVMLKLQVDSIPELVKFWVAHTNEFSLV